jgi:multisubunit Na+/H+ antiporter MnhF subunit
VTVGGVTVWALAAGAFSVLFGLGALAALRGSLQDRLVGLQVTQVLLALAALTAAIAADREVYLDLAIVASIAIFASTLVHARVAERWW